MSLPEKLLQPSTVRVSGPVHVFDGVGRESQRIQLVLLYVLHKLTDVVFGSICSLAGGHSG